MRLVPLVFLVAACGEGEVVINEVVARALDGESDAIELYNLRRAKIDLAGWTLGGAVLVQELKGREYLVIEFDGLGSSDEVELVDPDGIEWDRAAWTAGQAPEGASWGRFPDGTGNFDVMVSSLGKENRNRGLGYDCIDLGYASGKLDCADCGGVSPADCTPHPSDVILNEVSSTDEWFELHNRGTTTVSLSGLSVVDRFFDAPDRAIHLTGDLRPDERKAFGVGDDDGFVLDKDEHLTLRDDAGRALDFAQWEHKASTLCRLPDGGAWHDDCAATRGESNED